MSETLPTPRKTRAACENMAFDIAKAAFAH